jgi:hypothetical protein
MSLGSGPPEPEDVIGDEDPRASFENFADQVSGSLLASAEELTGGDQAEAEALVADVLDLAWRRWRRISRPGRDPAAAVREMLASAASRPRRSRPAPPRAARSGPRSASPWSASAEPGGTEPASAVPASPESAGAESVGTGSASTGPAGDGPLAGGPAGDGEAASAAAGLLDSVWRRRARRTRRRSLALACAAVVVVAAAVVTPLIVHAQRRPPHPPLPRIIYSELQPGLSGPGSQGGPFGAKSGSESLVPATIFRTCKSANNGQVSANWQASSVQAGPVWFMFARAGGWPASRVRHDGKLTAGAALIGIKDGSGALITADPPLGLRFLGRSDAGGQYTPGSGQLGLVISGCPVGSVRGLTMFWQPYLSSLHGCTILEVLKLQDGPAYLVKLPGRPATPGCGRAGSSVLPAVTVSAAPHG